MRLERGGRPLGFGAVLRADGRILSALSALGHGNYVSARFYDNTVLGVRVVASDRASDLALLAPEGGHWTEGLRPSALEVAGPGTPLHRFRARGQRWEEAPVTLQARQSLLGRDGAVLKDALVLTQRWAEDELGSPLFDAQGEVVGLLVQACAPEVAGRCQLAAFGAPVSSIKQFLRKAPPREPLPAAWLGFQGVAAHDGSVAGVRVVSVEPGSPAARAGLSGAPGARADLVVAVDGVPVTTSQEMKDAINRVALAAEPPGRPGAENPGPQAVEAAAPQRSVQLLVYGAGRFRQVTLPLKAPRRLPENQASAAPASHTLQAAPSASPPVGKEPPPQRN